MATIDETVESRWDAAHAATLNGDEVALLLYRSNLLGADLRITNYAGGNTSGKSEERDPVTGQTTTVLWVKGSGGDIGTLTRDGLAQLRMERLLALRERYRGPQDEDAMVGFYDHCLFHPKSRAPSISALSSSCLKNLSRRLAEGLPIATNMAAAFCGRVSVDSGLMRRPFG